MQPQQHHEQHPPPLASPEVASSGAVTPDVLVVEEEENKTTSLHRDDVNHSHSEQSPAQPQPLATTTTTPATPAEEETGQEQRLQQQQQLSQRHRRRPRGVLAFLDDSCPLTFYPYSANYWNHNHVGTTADSSATTTTSTRHGPQSKRQRRRQMRRWQEQQQQQQRNDEESDTNSCTRPTTRLLSLETILQEEWQVVVLFLFDPQQAYSKKVRDGLVRVISSVDTAVTTNNNCDDGSCSASRGAARGTSHDDTTTRATSCATTSADASTTGSPESGGSRGGGQQKIACIAMPAPGTVVMMMPVVNENTTPVLASLEEEGSNKISSALSLSPSSLPSSSSNVQLDEFLKDTGFFLSTYTSHLAMVLPSSLGHKVPSLAVIPTALGSNVASTHEELALEWNHDHSKNDGNNDDVLDTGPTGGAAAVGCSTTTNAVAQAWLSGHSALGTVQQITAGILFPSCTIQ